MKTLIMLAAAVMVAGCAATPSNVVCTGGSKDMTCHARTAEVVVQGHRVVDTGR
jgi:uncharacterized lipoprotein YajG